MFGIVEENKKQALKEIEDWDATESQRTLEQEKWSLKATECENFDKWALYKEIMWRQKSREILLKEWGRNSKYFHKLANCHRRRNTISKLKCDGQWVSGDILKHKKFEGSR